MQVTVGRIIRMWPDSENNNSFILLIATCPESTIIDNITSHCDNDIMMNYIHKNIYICDPSDVSNNIVLGPGGRRTGRLVLNDDGSIRLAQNNHTDVGRRVDID